jgi:hypothetical protein
LGQRAYSHARTHLHGVLERDARDGVSAPDDVRERESPEVGGAPEGTRLRLPDDAPHAPWRTERRLEHGAVGRDRVPRPADAGRPREVRRRQPLQERAQQVNREARGDRDQIGLRTRLVRGGGRGAVGHGGGGDGRWSRVAGGGERKRRQRLRWRGGDGGLGLAGRSVHSKPLPRCRTAVHCVASRSRRDLPCLGWVLG